MKPQISHFADWARRAGRALGAGALACAAALGTWAPAQAQPVKTDHVTAELVALATAAVPGQPTKIGLRLQHIPHWHTYWRNPGDSGLPTTIAWTLPDGATVGEIEWPAPKRLPIGPLVNYGYEDDLLLPLDLMVPASARPGSKFTVKAQARWLVCQDVCIPEEAELSLVLDVADAGVTPGQTALAPQFAQAAAQGARPWSGWKAELQRSGNELMLLMETADGRAPPANPVVHFFPYTEQLIEPARHELYRTDRGYALRLGLMANAQLPAQFDGIAVVQSADPNAPVGLWGGSHRSAELTAAVRTVDAIALPAGAVRLDDSASPAASTDAARGSVGTAAGTGGAAGGARLGVLAALALAFLGGMVLNLMPCVFPVLSIKLLGLAQQGSDRRGLRTHAAAYSAGVVLSFLGLAAALLALRAAGGAVGWGFQLQEPGVVFVLALLFFALGLNLLGAFEFGNLLPQGLAGWRAQRPGLDAFGSGVLAVLAASPCTAPFMGAALGFAITEPAPVALAVFAALGVGMALPYALLVLAPGWRDRLPRPGPWMLRLKQGLAFPMFATVVWLLWVLGLQTGVDTTARVLLALVGLGFSAWLAGVLRSRPRTASFAGLVLVGAVAALGHWSWPTAAGAGDVAGASANAGGKGTAPGGGAGTAAQGAAAPAWQPYSDSAVQQHLAAGRTVFVDFTAAWCVSCQVNKRLVLNTDATQADFKRANVVLMRADWTSRDAEITAALARLGRNGVPVYALMRPGKEPMLLPEILTAGAVRDALATVQAATPVAAPS